MLLDSYAIADASIASAIDQEEKRRQVKLACGKGCGNCCKHQTDLPYYPHEMVGIYWYVLEKMTVAERARLKDNLAVHTSNSPCPFLVDGSCAIHPMRPIGCRQFNVFSAPCLPGEDPFFTRRDAVLTPLVEDTDRAFAVVIPMYNLEEYELDAAIRSIRSQIANLHAYDWSRLATAMSRGSSGG